MFRLALLPGLLAGLFTCATHADPLDLKIMSFNIRYGTANDGDNAWDLRKETVARAIASEDPDLVGLQECLLFQADYLIAQLPAYQWLGMGREKDGTGEMTTILYKKANFSPLASGTFWLSETPDVPGSKSWDTSLPRVATWARFLHGASGTTFYHFNTHFDHRGYEARAASGTLLASRAHALVKEADPVLLTGDFNSSDEEAPWMALNTGGFLDSWQTAARQEGPSATFNGFKAPAKEGKRIDWILHMGNVSVKRCAALSYNEGDRYPSDHLPIVAELTLNP